MVTSNSNIKAVRAEHEILVADVVALVEAGRIEEARLLLNEMEPDPADLPSLRHLQRAIEPPTAVAVATAPRKSLRLEKAWLKAHAHEHPGCWIAVDEDRLIAANKDRAKVVKAVRAVLGNKGALLFYQPADQR